MILEQLTDTDSLPGAVVVFNQQFFPPGGYFGFGSLYSIKSALPFSLCKGQQKIDLSFSFRALTEVPRTLQVTLYSSTGAVIWTDKKVFGGNRDSHNSWSFNYLTPSLSARAQLSKITAEVIFTDTFGRDTFFFDEYDYITMVILTVSND